MQMDGLTCLAATFELKSLVGGKVDKIAQPERDVLLMTVRSSSANVKVILSASPETCRVHITDEKPENPIDAPTFCMLLRKRLVGGRITDISQPNSDRIIIFTIDSADELHEIRRYSLVAEIMGKQSNIILLDGANRVVDSIRKMPLSACGARAIVPHALYEQPPTAKKLDPLTAQVGDFCEALSHPGRIAKLLSAAFYGLSPKVAELLTDSLGCGEEYGENLSESQRNALAKSLCAFYADAASGKFSPCILFDTECKPIGVSAFVPAMPESAFKRFSSTGNMLASFFASAAAQEHSNRLSHSTLKEITTQIERRERKLVMFNDTVSSENEIAAMRTAGELITSNMYLLKQGMSSTILHDYATDSDISVELDPLKTPAQNAQSYFKKYKRAVSAREKALQFRVTVINELDYLYAQADAVKRAATARELFALRDDLAQNGFLRLNNKNNTKKPKKQTKPEIESVTSADGFTIIYGKNAAQNDYVTHKVASGSDIWLHVKDMHGSHVIILTRGEQSVPNQTLLQAACVAAYNSSARGGQNVPVDYTQKKYVKKPSGALPGKVIYTNHKTLFVLPQMPQGGAEG